MRQPLPHQYADQAGQDQSTGCPTKDNPGSVGFSTHQQCRDLGFIPKLSQKNSDKGREKHL